MLKRFWNRLTVLQERRAAYWMLTNMSDIQLKDIGVTRADIRQKTMG